MKRVNKFAPADRYLYDFGLCSVANGFAQFDSEQDGWYFGNWINPTKLIWFSYAEGYTTLIQCETEAEFVDYVRKTVAWYAERDDRKPGIDPGFSEELKAAFERLGLGDLLH